MLEEEKVAPGVWIDTNINNPGLFTRKVRSTSPYGIHLDHTDSTQTFQALEVTALKVTYTDGTIEPAAARLKLPLSWRYRPYTAVNSTSEGIVRETLHVLSADLKGLITRDEDFELELTGQFKREDEAPIPFAADLDFEMFRDKRVVTRAEFFKDV